MGKDERDLTLMNLQTEVSIRPLQQQCSYDLIHQQMRHFTDHRTSDTRDEFWLIEHTPVYTQGQAGKPEHILNPTNIPIVQSDRGGQITYHGPGQLVIYLLLDLKRKKFSVRQLVCRIEQAVIDYLQAQNISAHRQDKAPGVYVNHEKICALGLRVRKHCTYHGLSFNVNMDLSPFTDINPCGYTNLKVTQLSQLGGHQRLVAVIPDLLIQLGHQLDYQTLHFMDCNND